MRRDGDNVVASSPSGYAGEAGASRRRDSLSMASVTGAPRPTRLRPAAEDGILRLSGAFLAAAALAALAIVLHYYLPMVDRAPYLAVDDGLANVSVSLSKLGRYGNLVNPMQGPETAVRSHGFYNYGPMAFYIGAALDWLFGSSYAVQRSIHLVSIGALSAAAFLSFRRYSLAAAGVFAALLAWIFWKSHWPMFRPDIVVSLFAGLGIAALSWAVAERRLLAWALAGFFIASAFTTHQIAWALIPGAGLVWTIAQWLDARERREGVALKSRIGSSLIAATLGGAAGILLFLVAIEFRLSDLFSFYRAYGKYMGESAVQPWEVYRKHFELAWGQLDRTQLWLILFLFGASGLMAVSSMLFRGAIRRQLLAILLPPFALGVAFQLSLFLYNNHHAGYVLAIHVTTLWSIAAMLAATLVLLRTYRVAAWRATEAAARAVMAVALVAAAMPGDAFMLKRAHGFASIGDYQSRVLGFVPDGAVVWGDGAFGLESGSRHQFVELGEAATYAGFWTAAARGRLAPDFLVLNNSLKELAYAAVARAPRQLWTGPAAAVVGYAALPTLFPEARYRLRGVVMAPPYGATRIYARSDGSPAMGADGPDQIAVAANDASTREWHQFLGAPMSVVAEAAEPVSFDLTLYSRARNTADRSVKFALPQGNYLIWVRLRNPTPGRVGFLAATATPQFQEVIGDLGFQMGQAPYFDYETYVALPVSHAGGMLYISQFDPGESASFDIVSVLPIIAAGAARSADFLALPPPAEWSIAAAEGRRDVLRDGVVWEGDRSAWGYQAVSPPIAVPPRTQISLQIPIEPLNGKIAFGVLDESRGKWIAQADGPKGGLTFNSGENRQIHIVVYSNNPGPIDGPVRFKLAQGRYRVGLPALYVDVLTSCQEWPGRSPGKPEHCQ